MAPEQWLGGDIDGRADLYSLGIVLYQLLTGSVPFGAPTSEGLMRQHLDMPVPPLASRRQGLPTGFEDVVQTALAKDPDSATGTRGVQGRTRSCHEACPDLRSPSRTNLASAGIAITTEPTPARRTGFRAPPNRDHPNRHAARRYRR